jgi:phosphomannomutase
MKQKLIVGISGLRGVVGKTLFPETALRYALAFGILCHKGKVVVARDSRASGKILKNAAISGLLSIGCDVVDLGICPTPTLTLATEKLKADGGICITASHNPVQWNALKFVSPKGLFLNETEFRDFAKGIVKESHYTARITERVDTDTSGLKAHIAKIVATLKPLDVSFRVGVDAVNGAGSVGLPQLLEDMGCKVYRLNCRFAPDFPRKPEPTSENLGALCRFVRSCKLDIGFACDPDCDRLSVVDEKGNAIGEENSLVLATEYILSKKKGTVVTNLSTTALMDYVTQKHNARLYRTRVGEANVVSKMKSLSAVIGGEGNGGIIYPKINPTRDAMVGAALILKSLAEQRKPLSTIMAAYPKFYLIKRKFIISKEKFEKKKEMIIDAFRGKLDFTDGLKIVSTDYWLHIRPSQTEHVVRVIGESKDRTQIENYIAKVKNILYQD